MSIAFPDQERWKSLCRDVYTKNMVRFIHKNSSPTLDRPTVPSSSAQKYLFFIISVITSLLACIIFVTIFSSLGTTAPFVSVVLPASLGLAGFIVVSGLLTILYLSNKRNPLTNNKVGFFKERHFIKVPFLSGAWDSQKLFAAEIPKTPSWKEGESPYISQGLYELGSTWVDVSSLDDTKSGVVLGYLMPKQQRVTLLLSSEVMGFMPIGVIIQVTYNIVRSILAPFYIIVKLILQSYSKNPTTNYSWKDIFKQFYLSLVKILKIPFYASALILAFFFSMINHFSGRVLVSEIEREWNKNLPLKASWWSTAGPMKYYVWEGEKNSENFGKNGFYILGCFQYCVAFKFVNGKIVNATTDDSSLTKTPEQHLVFPLVFLADSIMENLHDYTTVTAAVPETQETK